jgi:toxin ParE1/3/4
VSDFVLAPVARDDLHEIWVYYAIEIHNVDVADRIRDELFQAFNELVKMPGMGHYRGDLSTESLRFWRVRDYLVIYRSEKRPLEIVRVLHGKRDVQALLKDNLERE